MKKAVVILSHSSYSDIWEMMMISYSKYFIEKENFDFFISTDKVNPELENLVKKYNFKFITYEQNISWGKSLKQTIEFLLQKKYDYSLFSFDDLILTGFLRRNISYYIELMTLKEIDYIQMKNGYRSIFSFEEKYFDNSLHLVDNNDSYKGSLVFSILSKKLLNHILLLKEISDYNPWEYEINAHKFFNNFYFYCVPSSIVRFSNTIIKGKIDSIQLRFTESRLNYKYIGNRTKMSFFKTIQFQIKVILFHIMKNIVPVNFFNKIRVLKSEL